MLLTVLFTPKTPAEQVAEMAAESNSGPYSFHENVVVTLSKKTSSAAL